MHAHRSTLNRSHRVHTEAALVLSYTPKRKVYSVRGTTVGEIKDCPSVLYGADKVYPPGTRVMISTFPGVNWVIVGEIPTLSTRSGERSQEFDESPVDAAADVLGVLNPTVADERDHSYRDIDAEGRAEAAQQAGDITLQNNTERHADRALFRLFRFGSILLRSAAGCQVFFDTAKKAISLVGSKLTRKTAGYEEEIWTSTSTITRQKATRTQEVKSDVSALFTSRVDKLSIEGYIPPSVGAGTSLKENHIATRGQRIEFESFVLEVDNDTGTVRMLQENAAGDITIDLGVFVAGVGAKIQVGDSTILATAASVTTTVGTNTLAITEAGISLTGIVSINGITFDAAGVAVFPAGVTALDVTATNVTTTNVVTTNLTAAALLTSTGVATLTGSVNLSGAVLINGKPPVT